MLRAAAGRAMPRTRPTLAASANARLAMSFLLRVSGRRPGDGWATETADGRKRYDRTAKGGFPRRQGAGVGRGVGGGAWRGRPPWSGGGRGAGRRPWSGAAAVERGGRGAGRRTLRADQCAPTNARRPRRADTGAPVPGRTTGGRIVMGRRLWPVRAPTRASSRQDRHGETVMAGPGSNSGQFAAGSSWRDGYDTDLGTYAPIGPRHRP